MVDTATSCMKLPCALGPCLKRVSRAAGSTGILCRWLMQLRPTLSYSDVD